MPASGHMWALLSPLDRNCLAGSATEGIHKLIEARSSFPNIPETNSSTSTHPANIRTSPDPRSHDCSPDFSLLSTERNYNRNPPCRTTLVSAPRGPSLDSRPPPFAPTAGDNRMNATTQSFSCRLLQKLHRHSVHTCPEPHPSGAVD